MKHKIKRRKLITVIALIVVIAAVGCAIDNYLQYKLFYPLSYYEQVCTQAEKYDLDPLLVMSVIKAESKFNPEAVSDKDATGLMQITPDTALWVAKQMGIEDYATHTLINPQTNIEIGVWYIDYLIDYYDGHMQLALAAYNAGTGTVDKWLENEQIEENGNVLTLPYKETSNYLVKINTYYEKYKQLYSKENG